ncbi:MAG: tRNA (guanine-N(1)-)-methyltransferase [Firmicutes bacterium ADurb.Bin182]|nr:MAG: tRNA (guanine-N(1)-)-methyltransferase [Firmicutes bacterium ADurb.Bin182]
MRIDVLTLFPQMFDSVMGSSILSRAVQNGLIEFHVHNIREYSDSKHKNTDDYPFGGGAGMVMMAQPIFDCMEAVFKEDATYAKRVLMSPRGRLLTQDIAGEYAKETRLVIVCGHYEGVDERVSVILDDEISIGDYVVTGGELPAMVLIDCVSRLIPGVLGSSESAKDESFTGGLLEYPQYTRPAQFRGLNVPEVLLNGNHAKISDWRRKQALLKTKKCRPDLLAKASLTAEDMLFLEQAEE